MSKDNPLVECWADHAVTLDQFRELTKDLPGNTRLMSSIKKDHFKGFVTRVFLQPDGEETYLVVQHRIEDMTG